jgi:hypothetical protein
MVALNQNSGGIRGAYGSRNADQGVQLRSRPVDICLLIIRSVLVDRQSLQGLRNGGRGVTKSDRSAD